MSTVFFILMGVSMAVVVASLGTGLVAMARGGAFNARYANRLMRLRVIAQGCAILFFALGMLA